MKPVISAKDIEAILERGEDLSALPAGAIVTPAARDLMRERGLGGSAPKAKPATAPRSNPKITAASPPAEIEAFFNSPPLDGLKEAICEVGRRLWHRNYVDGNGGNIAIKVSEDLVLCTPTLISKGFMCPADLCLVDLEGNQKAGTKKRTSEILMHLQIMKRQPKAKATVHCHPPHATAYAVAGVEPPTCMIPEIEVFVGKVPIAPYRTPGTPEMGKLVADLVDHHNTILMANHGVVSWSHLDVEDAYFKMEIVEAYCRTIWVASQLGTGLKTFSADQLKDLLKIKQGLGIPDPRLELKECELCDNSEWRPGVQCAATRPESDGQEPSPAPDDHAEQVVQAVTEQIMKRLGSG